MYHPILFLALSNLAFCNSHIPRQQEVCNEVCDPRGASTEVLPQVGTALSGLYTALITSVDPNSNSTAAQDGPAKRQDGVVAFCCARKGQCYLLEQYSIPFCYDEFTTDYFFPDGSYGSIVTGAFHSASGVGVDLIYGTYKGVDGSEQNIYSSTSVPDTTTMPMPTPWTSTGVGTAIPASELGSIATFTTTASASIVTVITLPSLTISAGSSACSLCLNNHSITITGPGIPLVTANTSATVTATASSNGSSGGSSMIIPPIMSNWAECYTILMSKFAVVLTVIMVSMISIQG